jgi:hypothetical protein
MMRRETKMVTELFRVGGPLGDFSTKINVGFLIGRFRRDTFCDLLAIKDMRNDSAHKLIYRDFTSQSMEGRAKNLKTPERYVAGEFTKIILSPSHPVPPNKPRDRFILTCQVLSIALGAHRKETPPEPLF